MAFETIILKKEGRIATITLNRPEKLNAINQLMTEEIRAALDEVSRDDGIRVLILTGAGRGFCSGVDFGVMGAGQYLGDEMRRILRGRQQIVLGLQRLEKPTIAMVNGVCVGAGFETACACDLRIASEKARFQVAYTRIGLVSGWGGTWLLPRLIGVAKAAELIFTGDFLEAREAERIGLLNRLVPAERLEEETMTLARRLADGPPIAIRLSKLQIYKGLEMDLEAALEMAAAAELIASNSEDHREGVAAFMEKRAPHYVGR
jgi:enoyl-CoA hydratase/carnithine racemase